MRKIKSISQIQIISFVLIIAAFVIGSLYAKVQFLEGKSVTPTNNQQAVTPSTAPAVKVDVSSGHFPMKGKSDAKVTIIEFADFRCPFCEQFFSQTESQLIKDYVDTGKANFSFRQYPFLGPASIVAADAAECANDQNKFWEFHDFLYKNQPAESDTSMYTSDILTKDAVSLGMDGNKFKSCLDTKADDGKVQSDLTDGQKAGVSGTPTFFINGIATVGNVPYSTLQLAINSELAK